MFVFTGHRGPDGCRRSKNKSSTDFWSFVWRISPQHFWHISTFACFCFTELAAQLSSSRPHQPKTQESCLLSSNHSFGWGGVISAYSDFSFSIETLGRFPEKEQIAINSHLLSILTSKVPISQLSRSGLSIPVSQNSEFWFWIPNGDGWSLSNCQVPLDQTKGNLTTGFGHDVAMPVILSQHRDNFSLLLSQATGEYLSQ